MPHRRDPMKCEERPGRGAQRQGEGGNWQAKDSTPVSHGTAGYTPGGRKSTRDERRTALLEAMDVPAPWKRLADVTRDTSALLAFDVDQVLSAVVRRPLPRLTAPGGRR